MNKFWTGVTGGLLAGAAGATAKNAVSYLDQALTHDAPPSSPNSSTVAQTAGSVADAAGAETSGARVTAAGALGGLGIGLGVGAVAGVVRGANRTPNPLVAALITGLAAMGVGDGLAAVTHSSKKVTQPTQLARDVVSHTAYGAVTAYALHRILDPAPTRVSRLNLFA